MKNLKILNNVLGVILLFSIAVPKTINSSERANLLNERDVFYEFTDRNDGPELHAGLHETDYWESYNQWMCFDADIVKLDRVEVTYAGKDKVMPQLAIHLLGHAFDISLSAETEYDFDAIYNRWKELLSETKQVCVYAAHLPTGHPDEDPATSIWVITRLKTELGYWNEI